jgi:hypothetical protein
LALTRVLVDGKECGKLPARTQQGKWYEVECSLKGSSVRLVTTRNEYLSISGFEAYAGGRRTGGGYGSSRMIKLTNAHQSSPYGNGRFPAMNAIDGSGKFTHTNKGTGQYWEALFNGKATGQASYKKVANRRYCTGYKPNNHSFRKVEDCLAWVMKTDSSATHFFFRHEGNYHCAICPKSYTGGVQGTQPQNSRIYTYEIVAGTSDPKLEAQFGGDHQGACRKSDGKKNRGDFKITKAKGGDTMDCLRQCAATKGCTAVGTFFPSGDWKKARDCALHTTLGYGPSGLASHKKENCFVKGGQAVDAKPVISAKGRYCSAHKNSKVNVPNLNDCLAHVRRTDPNALHFMYKGEGNRHCASCQSSYKGGNSATRTGKGFNAYYVPKTFSGAKRVAYNRYCVGYKKSAFNHRSVTACMNWVKSVDGSAKHFFFRHEGNYHCSPCPSSYVGTDARTGFQNSNIYTYAILSGNKTESSLEKCSGKKCSGYRGKQNQTKSGKTCQRWDQQKPHKHTRTP